MYSRRSLLGSVIGLAGLAALPDVFAGAQSPERARSSDPALSGYLGITPLAIASLDQALPLMYGNAQLQMQTVGFELPFEMSDEFAVNDWVVANYRVMLPEVFRRNAMLERFQELTGLHIGQIFSGSEIGEPPAMVTMLRGDFDREMVLAAQRAAGYREVDLDGRLVLSLSEDASFDMSNDLQLLALARLNNAMFFDDGTLVYTPTLAAMRTMANGGPTLEESPIVQQALAVLDSPLVGGAVVGPGAFVPDFAGELLQPSSQDQIADFIQAQQDRSRTPIVLGAIVGGTPGGPLPDFADLSTPVDSDIPESVGKFALVYATADEATLAAELIDDRLASENSRISNAPWTEVLASWSVVAAAGENTVLLTMEWPGLPRALDLLFARDLAFITG